MKYGKDVRVCVIGAGPSGITAGKHLLQAGIQNIVIYEKNHAVGGNWLYSSDPSHSSVYETTHIVSSKTMSQYADYPMPDHYPDYPSHRLLLHYFQGYAKHFGVEQYIQFNTCVEQAELQTDETWKITLDNGQVELFDYLLVANGHHWNPRMPNYEGEFTGDLIHSHYYKNTLNYRGKRVLVIGGGNSASDIVSDISRVAEYTGLSWRRAYHVIPKFMFGQPPDVINARTHFLPRWLREPLFKLTWKIVVGSNRDYGLPEPEHSILSSHPIVNSHLLHALRHGDIHPKPDIHHFSGKEVHFIDGTVEKYDCIIAATGYKITFPFFDTSFIDYSEGHVPLYLRIFHPEHHNLFFIGLLQPQGCLWNLSEAQAQVVANYILGAVQLPQDMQAQIDAEIADRKRKYNEVPRHTLEVEFHQYLGQLHKTIPNNAPQWKQVQI